MDEYNFGRGGSSLSACGKRTVASKPAIQRMRWEHLRLTQLVTKLPQRPLMLTDIKLDVVSVTKGGQSYNGTQVSVQIMVNNTAQEYLHGSQRRKCRSRFSECWWIDVASSRTLHRFM